MGQTFTKISSPTVFIVIVNFSEIFHFQLGLMNNALVFYTAFYLRITKHITTIKGLNSTLPIRNYPYFTERK